MNLLYVLTSSGDITLWGYVVICFFLVDIVVAGHILLNKHDEPVSAILWLFLVFNFHIFGVLAYFLLGINRVKSMSVRMERSDASMSRERERGAFLAYAEKRGPFLSRKDDKDPVAEHARMLDRLLPRSLPLTGNHLELLEDGTDAYPRMLRAIESAQKHIHLQSFIIMDDEEGQRIFSALEEKAMDGVEVRVLYDRLGSAKAYSRSFFALWGRCAPRFEIKSFALFNPLALYRVQLRNHRKLLIIDGRKAFVGGINISAENDARLQAMSNAKIHDLHSEIEGPSVGEFQYAFLRDWSYATGTPAGDLLRRGDFFPAPKRRGDTTIRVVASGPGQDYEASEKLFMTAVTAAKRFLWIITPYFVPNKGFITALRMTAARGVDVRIIIPRNNNHWYVRYATSALYQTLLEDGVRVFERGGVFCHTKAMMVDGSWATMGSSNCDNRSFRLNYELDFVVEKGPFLEELYRQFQFELSQSEEITLPLDKDLRQELFESFCSLLTPIL